MKLATANTAEAAPGWRSALAAACLDGASIPRPLDLMVSATDRPVDKSQKDATASVFKAVEALTKGIEAR